MVKIIDKINSYIHHAHNEPFFSFEFFPTKTDAGLENLFDRIDRMVSFGPLFVNVTWGAGGATKDSTMAICEYSQTYLGVDVLMHLTCSNLTISEIRNILTRAKSAGIQNILVLRGDLPKGSLTWPVRPDTFSHAIDLVRLIRQEFGDYFCIAVAGFPEGHPQSANHDNDIQYLKEKIDAGADFVITQIFFEPQVFLTYIAECKAAGITCPIIPGLMPIQSLASLRKLKAYCQCLIPQPIWDELAPVGDNDEEVKAIGVRLCTKMCTELFHAGIQGFHFSTMNLESSVLSVLRNLNMDGIVAKRRCVCCHQTNYSSTSQLSCCVMKFLGPCLGEDLAAMKRALRKMSDQ
jgi:methylenetetrahydrofolate reductase (NADPH)